jgi:hypothetical protein
MIGRKTKVQQAIEYFETHGTSVKSYQPPDIRYHNGNTQKQAIHYNLTGTIQKQALSQNDMRRLHRGAVITEFLTAEFGSESWFDEKLKDRITSSYGPFGELITQAKEWRGVNLVTRAISFANFARELQGIGVSATEIQRTGTCFYVRDTVYYAKGKGFHLGNGSSYVMEYRYASPADCATLLFEPQWQGKLLQSWDLLVPLDKLSKLVAFL